MVQAPGKQRFFKIEKDFTLPLHYFPSVKVQVDTHFPSCTHLRRTTKAKLSFFPGIADAISRSGNLSAQEREAAIRHEVWKVSRAIQRAARVLRGEFSRQNEQSNFTSMVTP